MEVSSVPIPLTEYLQLHTYWGIVLPWSPSPLLFLGASLLAHLGGYAMPEWLPVRQQTRDGQSSRAQRKEVSLGGAIFQGWVRSLSPLCCHLPSSTDLPNLSLCFAHRQPGSPGWPKPGFGQKCSRLRRVKDRSLDGWRRLLGIIEGAVEEVFLVAHSPLSHDLWLWPLTRRRGKKRGKRKKKGFQNNFESACTCLCFHLAA